MEQKHQEGKPGGLILKHLRSRLLLLLSRFSHVRLLATPWTAAHQAPRSMGLSRQEYWVGCHTLRPCLCLILDFSHLSYDKLLLGPPYFMIWWVSQNQLIIDIYGFPWPLDIYHQVLCFNQGLEIVFQFIYKLLHNLILKFMLTNIIHYR